MEVHLHHFFETLAAIATIIALLLPWLWRWTSRINVSYQFSKDVAENHLPHVQSSLSAIAKKLDVDIPEPPPIRFIEINGRK